MTTVHNDSVLAPGYWDIPSRLGTALGRLVELLPTWRERRRLGFELRAPSDIAPGDLRLTHTRIDLDPKRISHWLRLEWH